MKAFVCRYVTFQFGVMLFRLMNAPSTFQRMMDKTLEGDPFESVYLNDVKIFLKVLKGTLNALKR